MGRFGWRSGYLKAQNLQAGKDSFASTEETVSVSYPSSMKTTGTPVLTVVGGDTSNNTQTIWVSTQDSAGFTAKRAATGASASFNWVVMDDEDSKA